MNHIRPDRGNLCYGIPRGRDWRNYGSPLPDHGHQGRGVYRFEYGLFPERQVMGNMVGEDVEVEGGEVGRGGGWAEGIGGAVDRRGCGSSRFDERGFSNLSI